MLPDGTLDTPKRGSVGDVAVDSDCVEAIEAFRQHEIHHRNLAKPPMTGLMWCQPNGKHWHRLCTRIRQGSGRSILHGDHGREIQGGVMALRYPQDTQTVRNPSQRARSIGSVLSLNLLFSTMFVLPERLCYFRRMQAIEANRRFIRTAR